MTVCDLLDSPDIELYFYDELDAAERARVEAHMRGVRRVPPAPRRSARDPARARLAPRRRCAAGGRLVGLHAPARCGGGARDDAGGPARSPMPSRRRPCRDRAWGRAAPRWPSPRRWRWSPSASRSRRAYRAVAGAGDRGSPATARRPARSAGRLRRRRTRTPIARCRKSAPSTSSARSSSCSDSRRAIRSARRRPTGNTSAQLAGTLLTDTRLYRLRRRSAALTDVARVMRDLETVLLETSMSDKPDRDALERVQRLIRKRDLVVKMQVVAAHRRESEAGMTMRLRAAGMRP